MQPRPTPDLRRFVQYNCRSHLADGSLIGGLVVQQAGLRAVIRSLVNDGVGALFITLRYVQK